MSAPIDLNTQRISQEALRLVPEPIARKHNVIPLGIADNTIQMAMAEESNIVALQEIAALTKMRVEPVLADAESIRRAIDRHYSSYHEIKRQFKDAAPAPEARRAMVEDISDSPVVKALDLIVGEAVKSRTSDIHIEPQESSLRIRYRIDGVLHDKMSLPISAHEPLISRIKVMANMNIADHRPQDGQFSITVRNQVVDVRVATIDVLYGEMGCLRILDKSFASRQLSDLGFFPENLKQYEDMLKSTQGMLVVAGPTGSGKTTTLYASINSLDCKSRKVITIEDPVEYRFKDICQISVNVKAGLTFSNGLRSIMRHDPNVILVGEIRDPDTAHIAAQAALTGQFVLTSVHAHDTIGALFRLEDFGIGPFLLSATLIGVVSQRMARRVCRHCRKLTKVTPFEQKAYNDELQEDKTEFWVGQGCNSCADTGYLGRVAIFEILMMDQDMRAALAAGVGADNLRAIAKKNGMISMWRDGMLKVKAGITTPTEVIRVLHLG